MRATRRAHARAWLQEALLIADVEHRDECVCTIWALLSSPCLAAALHLAPFQALDSLAAALRSKPGALSPLDRISFRAARFVRGFGRH